ncbi:hypothetical protein G4B88_014398 [Cannabis sativa]|uniref:Uncharacterized protein n=1 Tax=Cannabis sativa TaxID=3483 RepID=A0A7J6I8L6_CANSA|nr:hypothetical protein G4B88_014398 [Cannabis sativa]
MKGAMSTMDRIIDTIFVVHSLMPLIGLLRKIVAGSCIGGMKETQAMINFAAKQNITSHIELIPIHYVNTAMERLLKSFFSFFDFSIQNLNRGLRIRTSKDIEFHFV